jgi:hypothetical protein
MAGLNFGGQVTTERMASGMHNCNLEMILHDSNSFSKGLEMEPTYDIFKRRDDGYPFWITAVGTLKEARERTTSYALVVPGEYFIYSQGEGIILECVTPKKEERRASRLIWFMPQSWNSMHAPNSRLANDNSKAHDAFKFGPAFGRRTWSIRILNGEQLVYS